MSRIGELMDHRRDPRFRARFDCPYSAGRQEGDGTLVDLSKSGAHIEEASTRPPIGTKVRLYVFVHPVQPFELLGEVVRHTPGGFAIEYVVSSAELCKLVEDLAAIVAVPR